MWQIVVSYNKKLWYDLKDLFCDWENSAAIWAESTDKKNTDMHKVHKTVI